MLQRIRTITAGAILLGLAACGGDGGNESGTMSLAVTDAPVDDARSVVVQFNAVAFKPRGESEIIRNVLTSARQLDLLAYQEGRAALLLDDIELPAGDYEWVRLMVDAEPQVRDSYLVQTTGEECELTVPSGALLVEERGPPGAASDEPDARGRRDPRFAAQADARRGELVPRARRRLGQLRCV